MAWKCKHCGKVNRKESSIAENMKMIDILYKALRKGGKPISPEAMGLWNKAKIKIKELIENEKEIQKAS